MVGAQYESIWPFGIAHIIADIIRIKKQPHEVQHDCCKAEKVVEKKENSKPDLTTLVGYWLDFLGAPKIEDINKSDK